MGRKVAAGEWVSLEGGAGEYEGDGEGEAGEYEGGGEGGAGEYGESEADGTHARTPVCVCRGLRVTNLEKDKTHDIQSSVQINETHKTHEREDCNERRRSKITFACLYFVDNFWQLHFRSCEVNSLYAI